ncbi:hypothetical protein BHE74_00000362 [Ensete ventricosum]|nr:hypothetical protein BHE74_00000362 [Ensete ventricosum]
MRPDYPRQDGYSISTTILSTALVLLALAVAVIVLLHLYVRHVLRRRLTAIDRLRYRAATTDADEPPPAVGLDPSAIAALPAFPFRRSSGSKEEGSAAECAVCLGAAEEGEMVRLLPDCKHLFHVGCIDMWLASHMTCPVCRAMVEPPPVTATLVRESSSGAAPTSAQEGTSGSKEPGSVSSRLGASMRRMLSRERSTRQRAQGEATEDLERQDHTTTEKKQHTTPSPAARTTVGGACSIKHADRERYRDDEEEEAPASERGTLDYTLGYNANLIIGGISPKTHHPGEDLSLQEQLHEIRRKIHTKVTTRTEHPCAPSLDSTSHQASLALVIRTPAQHLSTPRKMSLLRHSQPRGEPYNPRFHSLRSKMGTCLPTPQGDTGVYSMALG